MAYRKIGSGWDSKMREDIDSMFIELYKEYTGAGLDATEAREKALQAVADALIAKEDAAVAREIAQQIVDGEVDKGALIAEIERKLNELETQYAPDLNGLKIEVGDGRGDEATLGDNLNSIKTDLAQTEDKMNLEGWELQNKIRKIKPLVTVIDDDGRTDVLTKLKPLSEKYGVPFTVTAYVRAIEDESATQYMNKNDLAHLQNDLGWEISSHTYSHLNLGSLTYEEQDYEMRHSKDILEKWGLKVDTICYPYDGRNESTYELARKYYRAGRRTGGGINTSPLETYEMRSVPLGSWFDYQGGSPHPTDSLEYYKYQVDQAIEENGWLIFMTHVADPDHDATQQQHLEEIIQYIQSKGIEIVTYNEGLNKMGNIIDTGHYSRVDTDKKHFTLGAGGSLSATDVQDKVKSTKVNEYTNSNKPSDFEFGKIYQTRISSVGAEGLPTGTAGNLTTNAADGFSAGLYYLFQEYRPINTGSIYIRFANSNDLWGEWSRISGGVDVVTLSNSIAPDSHPAEFGDFKVIYQQVTGENTVNMPNGVAGVLITNRTAVNDTRYNYQIFHPHNSTDMYKRIPNAEGVWSSWVKYLKDVGEISFFNVTVPGTEVTNFRDIELSLPGVKTTHVVTGSPQSGLSAGVMYNVMVKSNDKLTIRYHNLNAEPVALSNRTWRFAVRSQ